MSNIELIQSLINEKAEAEARLNLIPYDGSPEVKENSSGKYLYIRKYLHIRLIYDTHIKRLYVPQSRVRKVRLCVSRPGDLCLEPKGGLTNEQSY